MRAHVLQPSSWPANRASFLFNAMGHGPLDNVAVHLDGAVVKGQFQTLHVFGDLIERFAKA